MGIQRYDKLESGDIIGGLEVLEYSHTDCGNNRWLNILCECGTKFKAAAWRIKSGHTKSCGCLIRKVYALRNIGTPYKERCIRAKKGWKTRKNKEEQNA